MDAHTLACKEEGASKHLGLTHLISPTVFELKNGQVGCTLFVDGVSFDTTTGDELNSYRRTLHHAVSVLGDEFCIYTHTIRRKLQVHLEGKFNDEFCKQVDTKYHQQFTQANLYTNDLYITILYKGFSSGKFGKGLNLLLTLSNKAVKSSRQEARNLAVGRLKKCVQQFKAIITKFKPRLLGEQDEALGYSELLSFYGLFVNGLEPVKFKFSTFASPMMKCVDEGKKVLGLYPEGNLANYLPTKRLFMGEYIEFKSSNNQSRFGAMVSVKSYGDDTFSIMLNKLLHLDCEFSYTNSFAVEPLEIAKKKIGRHLIKMQNAEDASISQMQQLERCQDDLASERLKVGSHHNTLMLMADDIETLQENVNKVIKIYSDVAMVATQETIGMEPMFWAQMPGNQKYIIRSSLITSQNFVDFCPHHNYRTGYCHKNHLGSAVTLIETPSKTPMFFNYHAKGSGKKNDLTPGHTTIIGGNGSGKTVFMGFMDSQMSRYGGRSFFFDRDRGLEIYVRATGGVYSIISPEHPEDVNFNPFWLKDSPTNRSFLKKWMGQLVKEGDEEELPSSIEKPISECVDYAFDSLQREHRSLSNVTRLLPIDFPRWDRLHKWMKRDGIRNDGEYAYLFDNEMDELDLSSAKMGFDFTELMNQPKNVMTAVCMYLVHRIEESLDGSRVSIYFDEGWQILDNDYWKQKLKEILATFRKNNGQIILATQSPESIVNSSISAMFLDNSATNIFFCNPKANFEKHYKHFNVSVSEFDFIKNTPQEKRLFLYKQSDESAICKLNLSGMDDEMAVWSGNKATVNLLAAIRKEVGNNPKDFLPLFYEKIHQMMQEGAI